MFAKTLTIAPCNNTGRKILLVLVGWSSYLVTPNPPPAVSIAAPLHLPLQAVDIPPASYFSALLSHNNKKDMESVITVAGNATIDPVIELMMDVIYEEDNRQILQTDLRRGMGNFLNATGIIIQYQQKELPEIVKIWLQLLQNSLREAKRLLSIDRSGRRQSCLDCLVCVPSRLYKEIRDWNALFDQLCDGFQTELFQFIVLPDKVRFSLVVDPVMEMMKDVIKKEDSRQILQIDLRPVENLLQDFATLSTDEHFGISALFECQHNTVLEIVKAWLQSLLISLTKAEHLLSVDQSIEIRDWKAFFVRVYQGFQSNLSLSVTSLQFLSSNPWHIEKEASLRDEEAEEPTEEAEEPTEIGRLSGDENLRLFRRVAFTEEAEEPTEEAEEPTEIGRLSGDEGSRLFRRVAFTEEAEEPTEIGRLSGDEGWRLFRRVAFKDDQVSMDIEERARRFADECKGMPFAINIVAAAMIGQTSVDHWDTCFSLIKSVDPSFPATLHPGLDAELYRLLRWCYDALPNSNVKNCFLYCAFYMENQVIDSRDLVEMWIGEGLVKSKQGTYLMDMALGRKYLKLLLDRCFFQIVKDSTTVFRKFPREQAHDVIPSIRVHAVIREMAMYIAHKEENCLFMARQNMQNFRNNCRRISLTNNVIEDLPTDLRCPDLASLILKGNTNLKELPSAFVLSLTSLRVLNLSGCNKITSVPTSIEQLKMLEFLSLRDLPIEDLPKEVCRLSKLQFLDLSKCGSLKSLPSEIGEIKNLKCLNLDFCFSLRVIPREISELTSLSRLVLPYWMGLSMETEAPASIWSLKGLKNMTELRVVVDGGQQLKDGIMGSWSEMRHLMLIYEGGVHLPEDMKSMKKLQSFMLKEYFGSSLPNCKFEHLEVVSLSYCRNICDLSPLEWMPNLKLLKLRGCHGLRELGIGSRGSGSPSGYQRLQKLVLKYLHNLESLGGASKRGAWDERTLPHLRVLKTRWCESLQRFPVGMEKLPNLCAIRGSADWWQRIRWEDENMKIMLGKIFKMY